jgi:hypothetical protein
MPNFSVLGRRDASATEDAALAALLSGFEPADDLPPGLRPAADVVAALRARPAPDEFAGESAALTEFRALAGVSAAAGHRRRRRPSVVASRLSAKAAAAVAVIAVALGGVATAAYAGALPSPAQGLAHALIGAPAARKPARPDLPRAHAQDRPAVGSACVAGRSGPVRPLAASGARDRPAGHCGPTRKQLWPSHRVRPGCWPAAPHWTRAAHPGSSWSPRPTPSWSPHPAPSWSPHPTPSWSPRAAAVASSSCPTQPDPAGPPFPHRHRPFPIGQHFPHPGKPSRPVGKPGEGPGK